MVVAPLQFLDNTLKAFWTLHSQSLTLIMFGIPFSLTPEGIV